MVLFFPTHLCTISPSGVTRWKTNDNVRTVVLKNQLYFFCVCGWSHCHRVLHSFKRTSLTVACLCSLDIFLSADGHHDFPQRLYHTLAGRISPHDTAQHRLHGPPQLRSDAACFTRENFPRTLSLILNHSFSCLCSLLIIKGKVILEDTREHRQLNGGTN